MDVLIDLYSKCITKFMMDVLEHKKKEFVDFLISKNYTYDTISAINNWSLQSNISESPKITKILLDAIHNHNSDFVLFMLANGYDKETVERIERYEEITNLIARS